MATLRVCFARYLRSGLSNVQKRSITGGTALTTGQSTAVIPGPSTAIIPGQPTTLIPKPPMALSDPIIDASGEDDVKRRVLDASLKYVPSSGWTVDSVMLDSIPGAQELRYPDVMHGLFQDPGASLVSHFIRTKNKELKEFMKAQGSRTNEEPKINFGTFIGDAIKHRLSLNIPLMDRMPEALAIATRPDQVLRCGRLLLQMSDDICFHAGDRSNDISWYTKRTSVAGLYAATELYMIQDKSAHFEDTWLFLHRRMDDLKSFGKSTRLATSLAGTMLDLAYSFYVVGRNAVGMNERSQNWRKK